MTPSPEDWPQPHTPSASLLLPVIVTIAVLMIGAVLLAYYDMFGRSTRSTDPAAWGQFGDYAGGVLNPALSFLALLGLLVTVRQNQQALAQSREEMTEAIRAANRQARHAEREAGLRELLKVVDQLYTELGHLYQRTVTFGIEGQPDVETTYGRMFDSADPFPRILIPRKGYGTSPVNASCEFIAGRLHELREYLRQYETLSENQVVSQFFRRRFVPGVQVLSDLGYLAPEDRVFYERDIEI
jgi:hypothetical protein